MPTASAGAMPSRPRGGFPIGAPKHGGLPAVPAPRRTRGLGASPRLPGDAPQHKASKRRRPHDWERRQARRQRRQREEAAAAAADAPYMTSLASLPAWAAMGAAYWVLRTIRFGFRVPWASRPPLNRPKG